MGLLSIPQQLTFFKKKCFLKKNTAQWEWVCKKEKKSRWDRNKPSFSKLCFRNDRPARYGSSAMSLPFLSVFIQQDLDLRATAAHLLPEAPSVSTWEKFFISSFSLLIFIMCYGALLALPQIVHDVTWVPLYQFCKSLKLHSIHIRAIVPSHYLFLLKVPIIFMQLELSPPHTAHLSYCSFEPMMPSQPVRTHLPRTQTELLYGLHSVPSVTCMWETC